MKTQKKIFIILIIAMASLIITSCTRTGAASSWPGFSVAGDNGYVSFGNQTYAVDLKNGSLVWKYPAEVDRNRQAYSPPFLDDDVVIFGDFVSNLVAVNAANGVKQWEFNGAEDRYIASVDVFDGMIYSPNTDGYIYALNEAGELQWKFLAKGPNWTKPVSDESSVYIASMDHFVYALQHQFNAASLVLAQDGSKTLRSDLKWATDLGMAIVADPILENGILYVATIEGKLFALDAATGKIVWSFDDHGDLGAVWGAPVIKDSVIFVADIKGNVYTVEKDSGKLNWPTPFSAGERIIGAGLSTEDGVVYTTDAGKLFLINAEKEVKTISTFENAVYAGPALSGENIIIAPGSEEGLLTAINLEGFETWSFVPAE